ncbi:transglutaminase family protein [Segetibacter sp. 3557_3]|uniref:transglutaminase-like domain-containing protein n=1 Tax=Segetibacter sp. 3557_3 TaxID=2547429 RepID=UPI001059015F|nr:transglutaminase family protein [Segetibacter sp. 3557_3]TDH26459.1 transglutaminase family protein [Segetibacter sp. 3557_3]
MKFEVNSSLSYTISSPSTLLLNIHALRSARQTVIEELFTIEPYIRFEELNAIQGENRFTRLEITEPCDISITYKATVDNHFTSIDFTNLEEEPVSKLETSVFPYLYPSRYCQSDKLFRFANTKFGNIANPFEKVVALTDWIYKNVEYLSGSTNSQTSAYDTVTEQAGVCRDFAHLGIALCRALTIPARYFTGYAYQLNPPDFHACFEAYLGGNWILFDATKLAPLNGLIKIATGRDAADSAVATIFGNVSCNTISVQCHTLEQNFEPLFYDPSKRSGLSYE